MKILLTGGSGMIGRYLTQALISAGHQVLIVSRSPKSAEQISWSDPFPEVDAAIHLAGERVNAQRWTPSFLQRLRASRVDTALKLKSKLTPRCRVVITASGANGYPHGNFSSPPATEDTPLSGQTHLGVLCADWEGIWKDFPGRTVALRTGFVISSDDSGIQTMLPLYKWGLGGVLGNGRQRMPWIGVEDLVRIFLLALSDEGLKGQVNAVSPQQTTFAQFNAAFAHAVRRPAFWRIPGWAVRALFGPMADEMLLCDAPVEPRKLLDAGFVWQTPSIDAAMVRALSR